ncbi:hypothetical protein FS837_006915 [Tulasnella sp. UAMH 9824]|nr:hypothetical protein FS837_006915 [Tulasnella sp. UAMH 9824]
MSSWATFTSSVTSPSSLGLSSSLSSPPTPTYTHAYAAYHQLGCPELLFERRYPQAGDQGPPLQGNSYECDYQLLQKLVKSRESKLADCSYLTRQRKEPIHSIGTTANQGSVLPESQAQPTPRINPASEEVLQAGEAFIQREHNVTKAPTGPEERSGNSTFNALNDFKFSWSNHVATDALGSQFGRKDSSGRLQFP